uniref:Uncharacterized protein n=1 Tax=Chlamydomonas leiostraca TaxID=1034604 RepID=A0A7S0S0M7_9CHLO
MGCCMAGLFGTGNGTTSYAENIGAIGITGVGSRRVVQVGAAIMLVLAVLGKFGALFASIPGPILSGLFCCMFGLIVAVGISNLQFTDQNSPRNLFIVGFSIYMGLSVPQFFGAYAAAHGGKGPIATGSSHFNDILNTLCNTPMVVSLVIAFLLDNTIPGTFEERGLHHWAMTVPSPTTSDDEDEGGSEGESEAESDASDLSEAALVPEGALNSSAAAPGMAHLDGSTTLRQHSTSAHAASIAVTVHAHAGDSDVAAPLRSRRVRSRSGGRAARRRAGQRHGRHARDDPEIKAVYDLPWPLHQFNEAYIRPAKAAVASAARKVVRAMRAAAVRALRLEAWEANRKQAAWAKRSAGHKALGGPAAAAQAQLDAGLGDAGPAVDAAAVSSGAAGDTGRLPLLHGTVTAHVQGSRSQPHSGRTSPSPLSQQGSGRYALEEGAPYGSTAGSYIPLTPVLTPTDPAALPPVAVHAAHSEGFLNLSRQAGGVAGAAAAWASGGATTAAAHLRARPHSHTSSSMGTAHAPSAGTEHQGGGAAGGAGGDQHIRSASFEVA